MDTITTVRSWGAIALGGFCAGITGIVMFSDVFAGASLTTEHALSLAGIVLAVASGHLAWPAMRQGMIVPGVMLAIIFLGSTAFVVVSSGARNAEQAGNKAAAIEAANTERKLQQTLRAEAEAMLKDKRKEHAEECKSGEGKRCKGIQKSIDVYVAAIAGHDAKLAGLPSPKVSKWAQAAKMLQSLGANVTADWLELNMPFVITLITELGVIAFLHLGLGHAKKPEPIWKDEDVAPMPEQEDDRVLSFCKAFKKANGRAPTIPEVQSKFPDCAKTTAWRRAKAA